MLAQRCPLFPASLNKLQSIKARGAKEQAGLKMEHSSHEVFSRNEKVVPGSDRSFGLVMAGALAALTSLNAWHSGRLWPWTGGLAALLLAAALLRPALLHP